MTSDSLMGKPGFVQHVQVFHSILEIDPRDWPAVPEFPFVDYHFLAALETTGCLGARTGWEPRFLVARENNQFLGVLVLYAKTNSYGEYIFDFAWAQAYQQMKLPYYPKLTSAVPFTPATGPKLLWAPHLAAARRDEIAKSLLEHLDQIAEEVSSVHHLFVPEEQQAIFAQQGYLLRHSFQFHWHNRGYAQFQDFLGALRSKRRREIGREREQVRQAGVKIERLSGERITAAHAAQFYSFYLSTIDKRQSYDYLTEEFFAAIFARMPDKLLLVWAVDRDDQPVAAALNLIGSHCLHGRYWGCLAEYRALHFEVCYYQGIEFAIEHKLNTFEAGAQGEHKFQRGFLPRLTFSAHKIRNPVLARAIHDHVEFEKVQLARVFEDYAQHSPFRTDAATED